MKYDFTAIEKKWQQKWLEEKTFAAKTGETDKPKFYGLVEFPYPSGNGLHVGHARPYTAMDVVARKKRMDGYNVLFPIGFDAFGLPTENYAIKNHIHPAKVTHDNIANFTKQLHMLGYSFDWDRVVDTTDPKYYKWTQWIFLQLYQHGLAYKTSMPVNWCTSCKCVLANEEVVEGVCERCGSPVIRKEKSQWMLRITKYAQRLIDDLDDLDFIERVKIQQKNWIGRSTGAEVTFPTTQGDNLVVYTTRPDTLFGATYMVLAPEHPYIEKWKDAIANWDAVTAYVEAAAFGLDGLLNISPLGGGTGDIHEGSHAHLAVGGEELHLDGVFLLKLVDELPGRIEVGGLGVVLKHPGRRLGLALQGGGDGGQVVVVNGQGEGGHGNGNNGKGGHQGIHQPAATQHAPAHRLFLLLLSLLLPLAGKGDLLPNHLISSPCSSRRISSPIYSQSPRRY